MSDETPPRNHKDLEVWKQAMDLVDQIYGFTRRFPAEELYALVSQMRTAAVSVPSNLAEAHIPRTPRNTPRWIGSRCMEGYDGLHVPGEPPALSPRESTVLSLSRLPLVRPASAISRLPLVHVRTETGTWPGTFGTRLRGSNAEDGGACYTKVGLTSRSRVYGVPLGCEPIERPLRRLPS